MTSENLNVSKNFLDQCESTSSELKLSVNKHDASALQERIEDNICSDTCPDLKNVEKTGNFCLHNNRAGTFPVQGSAVSRCSATVCNPDNGFILQCDQTKTPSFVQNTTESNLSLKRNLAWDGEPVVHGKRKCQETFGKENVCGQNVAVKKLPSAKISYSDIMSFKDCNCESEAENLDYEVKDFHGITINTEHSKHSDNNSSKPGGSAAHPSVSLTHASPSHNSPMKTSEAAENNAVELELEQPMGKYSEEAVKRNAVWVSLVVKPTDEGIWAKENPLEAGYSEDRLMDNESKSPSEKAYCPASEDIKEAANPSDTESCQNEVVRSTAVMQVCLSPATKSTDENGRAKGIQSEAEYTETNDEGSPAMKEDDDLSVAEMMECFVPKRIRCPASEDIEEGANLSDTKSSKNEGVKSTAMVQVSLCPAAKSSDENGQAKGIQSEAENTAANDERSPVMKEDDLSVAEMMECFVPKHICCPASEDIEKGANQSDTERSKNEGVKSTAVVQVSLNPVAKSSDENGRAKVIQSEAEYTVTNDEGSPAMKEDGDLSVEEMMECFIPERIRCPASEDIEKGANQSDAERSKNEGVKSTAVVQVSLNPAAKSSDENGRAKVIQSEAEYTETKDEGSPAMKEMLKSVIPGPAYFSCSKTSEHMKEVVNDSPSVTGSCKNEVVKSTAVTQLCSSQVANSVDEDSCAEVIRPKASYGKARIIYKKRSCVRTDLPCANDDIILEKFKIAIKVNDFKRLQPGYWMNDVLVDFYLKYLMTEKVSDVHKNSTHIFSSFFFTSLAEKMGRSDSQESSMLEIDYNTVKHWTKKVHIFEKKYLIIPINLPSHWVLAIIANAGDVPTTPHLSESTDSVISIFHKDEEHCTIQVDVIPGHASCSDDQNRNKDGCVLHADSNANEDFPSERCVPCGSIGQHAKKPCIFLFDSLQANFGSSHEMIFHILREYLQIEWNQKKDTPCCFTEATIPGYTLLVPQQGNQNDCGVYMLQYVENFLDNPLLFSGNVPDLSRWFTHERIQQKRHEMKNLIIELRESSVLTSLENQG